ncbi:ATP-binding protein [Streptomyces sp. NPDC059861]|uniref:sensor histidine kinase n=1 Tax=Streptomyces sp. NPDC059861 TaxID=3346974 RepID=UPI00364F2C6E
MTRRLLLSYLSLAGLVLLGLEIPLGVVYSRAERERIVTAANGEADAVAAFAELSLAAGRRDELVQRAGHCAERIGGQVVVLAADGTVLAASPALPAGQERALAARPEVAAALRGRGTTDVRASTTRGVHYLSVAAPVGHRGRAQGAVLITLPTDAVHDRVGRVWLLLALAGLAVLTGVGAVAFAFARWAGHPIRRLEEAAQRLADGSPAARVPITSGPPEVRSLASVFNRTALRLEHLLAAQQAFAGEASHQLKTPLAALRLRLENLEPAVARRARPGLAAAVTETDRLARMVEGLLAMARLEEDAAALPGPVGVGEVCAERHRTWLPLFEREGVSLVLFAGSVGPVLAVPGAVEQILDNLLSNALRASPAGSTVTVELRLHAPARRPPRDSRPCWVDLHVTDEGPGMTADQRVRAFDRFWRAPGAPKGGTGLGLSLVQRLAHASGGEVTLRPAATGGLDAVVRLPSAEPPPGRARRPLPVHAAEVSRPVHDVSTPLA